MAKNKIIEVPHYELLYIVLNEFSEEELGTVAKKVKDTIVDNGGVVTFQEEWGKKKLAYPIKHFNYGYYSLIEFDAESERVEKMNDLLRMNNEVLRHLIVVAKKWTKEDREKEESARIKRAEKEKMPKEEEKEEEKKMVKPEKKKVDLKDLDDKLNKILETDDLL
ncbi:30S ribosomal protein S6 [bacterium]|nr:30S ribosomal protein S6 [bacterium]